MPSRPAVPSWRGVRPPRPVERRRRLNVYPGRPRLMTRLSFADRCLEGVIQDPSRSPSNGDIATERTEHRSLSVNGLQVKIPNSVECAGHQVVFYLQARPGFFLHLTLRDFPSLQGTSRCPGTKPTTPRTPRRFTAKLWMERRLWMVEISDTTFLWTICPSRKRRLTRCDHFQVVRSAGGGR